MILYARALAHVCVYAYNVFFSRPVVAKDINQSEDIFDSATADQRCRSSSSSSSSSEPRRMAIKIINYINNARSHPPTVSHTHTRTHTRI